VWNEWLCSGHRDFVCIWTEWNQMLFKLIGHRGRVTCFASTKDFLFSGDLRRHVIKWNTKGECMWDYPWHQDAISHILIFQGTCTAVRGTVQLENQIWKEM